MELILIAAVGANNELGKDNKLIWYLPNDLKFFKTHTTGHPIIMGYNTFRSLPKLLPNRKHIVLTHHEAAEFPSEVEVYHDKDSLMASLGDDEEVFVIGGASIYKQFISDADKLLLTEVSASEPDADAFFPEFNKEEYIATILQENEDNGIKYKHLEYRRK